MFTGVGKRGEGQKLMPWCLPIVTPPDSFERESLIEPVACLSG